MDLKRGVMTSTGVNAEHRRVESLIKSTTKLFLFLQFVVGKLFLHKPTTKGMFSTLNEVYDKNSNIYY